MAVPGSQRPRRTLSTTKITLIGVAVLLGLLAAAALGYEIGSLVHPAMERSINALTPRPGSIPSGWLGIYVAVWGLVYGYLLYEGQSRRQRLWSVIIGVVVLVLAYLLVNKTEPLFFLSDGHIVGQAHSCGSWLSPSVYTKVAAPASDCVIKLDIWFHRGFIVAIGGLAGPLLYAALQ
jgi:hypothetical protein